MGCFICVIAVAAIGVLGVVCLAGKCKKTGNEPESPKE